MSHDGKPETESAISSSGRTVRLPESFEDMRQEPRLDADPGVGNGNLDLSVGAGQSRIDSAAFIGEFDGVRQQVPDCLLQSACIPENCTTRIVNDHCEGN